MTIQNSLQTRVLAKKKADVGGPIVGFVFIRRILLTVNSCLIERTGQTPFIWETEPSEL